MKLTPQQIAKVATFVNYVVNKWPEPKEKIPFDPTVHQFQPLNSHMMRWESELKKLINNQLTEEPPEWWTTLDAKLPTYEEFINDADLSEILDYFIAYFSPKE